MIKLRARNRSVGTVFAIASLFMTSLAFAQSDKEALGTESKTNQIEIKDFSFNPQILTVKSGDKVTWINRDEEPHIVVSVGTRFKKSSALDTNDQFTITAGAPGTYPYFCYVHPQMTGRIVLEK